MGTTFEAGQSVPKICRYCGGKGRYYVMEGGEQKPPKVVYQILTQDYDSEMFWNPTDILFASEEDAAEYAVNHGCEYYETEVRQ